MGDSFLDSVQGLKELKIFKADEAQHTKMNETSEDFRKITMKVLVMQLASTTIMDLVAYGGAGIGMHVIPVEQAIPATQQSVSVEHISYWLKKYENKYAVGACSCRRQQRVLSLIHI